MLCPKHKQELGVLLVSDAVKGDFGINQANICLSLYGRKHLVVLNILLLLLMLAYTMPFQGIALMCRLARLNTFGKDYHFRSKQGMY